MTPITQEALRIASLFLAVVFFYLTIKLLINFREDANTAWEERNTNVHSLLILGIYVSFVGEALDNTFWQIFWTNRFLEKDAVVNMLIPWGTVANLFSRHLLGIIAVYLHLKAFYVSRYGDNDKTVSKLMYTGAYLGFMYTLLFCCIKYL